jgi:ubiquinone/menaquinone biosynthesis C-methylase UbiE
MRTISDVRYRGVEILDEPGIDPRVVRQAMSDVTRANRLFGGAAAIAAELRAIAPALPRPATLLDVGTGMGDIAVLAQRIAAEHAVRLRTIGLDVDETLVQAAADQTTHVVRGDAGRLPFADKSIDVVVCSQVLHHFFDGDVPRVLRELDRVARVRVIIADLRRSRVAATLFSAAAIVLGFHPVSRHDGRVSIGRGFTTSDLQASIVGALGHGAYIRRRPGWRLTATWTPVATGPVTLASAA